MFDLSLAHLHRAERDRDISADLRARRILKAADRSEATDHREVPRRTTAATPTRVRATGR